jgi:hypothetical protein
MPNHAASLRSATGLASMQDAERMADFRHSTASAQSLVSKALAQVQDQLSEVQGSMLKRSEAVTTEQVTRQVTQVGIFTTGCTPESFRNALTRLRAAALAHLASQLRCILRLPAERTRRLQGMEHAKAEAQLARQHAAALEGQVERLALTKADLETSVSRPVLDKAVREMHEAVDQSVTVRPAAVCRSLATQRCAKLCCLP